MDPRLRGDDSRSAVLKDYGYGFAYVNLLIGGNMSFLISNAWAETTAAAPGQADSTFSMIMIAAIFILFYFMLIRPQNKRAKEHRDLVSKLQVGDEIVTSGGFVGRVVSLDEQFIKFSLASGVEVNLQRGAVSAVLPKGTLKAL